MQLGILVLVTAPGKFFNVYPLLSLKVKLEQHSKFEKSLVNWEKLVTITLRPAQKFPILNLLMTWENVCPKFHC